ncbi:transcriptional repressor LexA [Solimonas sp. SE-A11]|uniref:transcriptional repressor LexA n=1 Tax=Solimonas sp. SE-A11 TaxID=3054954 RepID=UPI00259CFAD7|nr:transcriptional repressor LexA [Solimonas sp. SE-A11]MDM4771173.1 transcriptional repressor LexA [Solimonas sp. SE-A11]
MQKTIRVMQDELLKPIERKALKFIRNRIAHGGSPPSVRDVQNELGYQSPRSAAQVIDRLIAAGFVRRRAADRALQVVRMPTEAREMALTVQVPLVGTVSCGLPILAAENIEAMVAVSVRLARPPHRYFLLRAEGDSMNEAGIDDGHLVLVRQQHTADEGEKVVALVDDEATIKEFRRTADAIVLMPRSSNKKHKPIILTHDFSIQGVVVTSIPDLGI